MTRFILSTNVRLLVWTLRSWQIKLRESKEWEDPYYQLGLRKSIDPYLSQLLSLSCSNGAKILPRISENGRINNCKKSGNWRSRWTEASYSNRGILKKKITGLKNPSNRKDFDYRIRFLLLYLHVAYSWIEALPGDHPSADHVFLSKGSFSSPETYESIKGLAAISPLKVHVVDLSVRCVRRFA